jgi:hypothetical protein
MKCIICLKIRIEHPEIPVRELFRRGYVEDAVVTVDGNSYCEGHFPIHKVLK